jgi:MYXO-CTERM domain-containing protein
MRGPFDLIAPHFTEQSSWLSNARACGTCHNVFNPLVRRRTLQGVETSMQFPEQTTYLEWAASALAEESTTCQDCHLSKDVAPIARNEGPRDRTSHAFVGGNWYLLDLIAFLDPGLRIHEQLKRGKEHVLRHLATAARLEVDLPASVSPGGRFSFRIRVINETGHKLPTGFPDGRRVFLALNSDDLAFNRGTLDPLTGEPIDPLAVYEAVHGQIFVPADGAGHVALNDVVLHDSRIPPRGMVSTATIAPVGAIYPELASGRLRHWDELTVTATAPCRVGSMELEASLYYQSATRRQLEALVDRTKDERLGSRLFRAWSALKPEPTVIAQERWSVDLEGAPADGCVPQDAGVVIIEGPSGYRPRLPPLGRNDDGCDCAAVGSAAGESDGFWGLSLLLAGFCRRRRMTSQRGSTLV